MTRTLAPALALLLALTACGADDGDGAAAPAASSDPAATALTVFAAASLTESFTELGEAYEAAHPGADVTFSFAGSQALVAQVQQGAPADVLATADQRSVEAVAGELAGSPQVFAKNQLAIVTEPGNPLGLTGLADLAVADVKVVLADDSVPVGRASAAALEAAGVVVRPVSEEQDVKAVLQKVRLGEADAGIVYVTDVRSAGDDVAGVQLPGVTNAYPLAALADAPHRAAADAFVAFVLSAQGQAVLASYGFLPPSAT